MIDKFKIRGILSSINIDKLVLLKEVQTENGQKIIYRIPGRQKEVFLYLTILEHSNVITIHGNLRKWWYGKSNVFNDLTYRSFVECLKYLAEIIGADLFELLQFKIRHVELGMNVKLRRKYDRILPSMKSFPKRNRLNYYDETIMFEGRKFDIKIYDKLRESAKKNISKRKIANKLIEQKFCMRFELDIRAKSGLKIKDKLDSLHTIKDYWNDVVDYLLEIYSHIEIIDEYAKIKEFEDKDLNLTAMKELFIFRAMDEMGIDKAYRMIYDFSGRKKSEYRKEFRRIFWKYRNKDKSPLRRVVDKAVNERLDELRKD